MIKNEFIKVKFGFDFEFHPILFSNYYEIEVMNLLLDISHPNNIFSPK